MNGNAGTKAAKPSFFDSWHYHVHNELSEFSHADLKVFHWRNSMCNGWKSRMITSLDILNSRKILVEELPSTNTKASLNLRFGEFVLVFDKISRNRSLSNLAGLNY